MANSEIMKNVNSERFRLGLDLGTNSIGWAAVRLDDDREPCGILDMGVRIFPDGRNPTDKTSNAVDRRVARGQRRRRDRYLKRRGELMDSLVELGLMPEDESQRKSLVSLDPYVLRKLALEQPLQPFELGRALFHLNQRRGFKSNRKAATEEAEGKTLSAAIGNLRRKIQDSGARTLGEFLASLRVEKKTVRAREGQDLYADRAMYQQEFEVIRKAQEPHHVLDKEQWGKLYDTIFYQRPLKPVDPGWCQFEYESEQKRAARALPVFQEFRILQEVNNLRVQVGTEPERPLEKRERERVLKRLRSGQAITLRKGKDDTPAKPTRDLGMASNAKFNLSRGGRKEISGDETTTRLIKKKEKGKEDLELFGSHWLGLSLEDRNEIVKFLLDNGEPEVVQQKAIEDWGLNEAQAEAVAGISLVSGYGNLSEKAINNILPHLEAGRTYDEAVVAGGYAHHSDFRNDEAHDCLPYYGEVLPRDVVGGDAKKNPAKDGEPARYGRFPNPTVHIGLNQLRRVANKIIEVYGKPEEIVVELARDLKINQQQKRELVKRQREGGQRNVRFTEMLWSAGQEPSAQILRKLRLWEEQGPPQARVCPFTGKQLTFEMVISSQTEVDHILPFSRTLDDSAANKVVCVAAANRDKGDRSPYEAFGHNPEGYDYQQILASVARFQDQGNKKLRRFQPDAMEQFEKDDRFLDRQLNETSYLSRTAKKYLAYLYDERGDGPGRVRAAPGRMTALLRRGWGLEGILRVTDDGEITGKQRDDHRHHAIDAFVVACTTQGLLQKFARAAGSDLNAQYVEERLTAIPKEALPWEGFNRSQLIPSLERLVVSYKPERGTRGEPGRTTGQLHNETAYGLVELSEIGPSKVVIRKKIRDFKRRSELEAVRDPSMRGALLELWDQESGDPDVFSRRAATEGVQLEGRRQQVRRVRVTDDLPVIPIRGRSGKPYKGYLPGGNEFADVWQMRDGSWQMIIVPKFHANQRDFNIEDFRPKDKSGRRDPTAKRRLRLQIDDLAALGQGPDRRIVRVRKITNASSGAFVVLDEHKEANVADRVGKDMRESRYSARQLKQQGFRKVGVNEIGRVRDPGPLKP